MQYPGTLAIFAMRCKKNVYFMVAEGDTEAVPYDGPPLGGPSGQTAHSLTRNGFGSQPVPASSRSAIAASSDFFALCHAGAVAPFTS